MHEFNPKRRLALRRTAWGLAAGSLAASPLAAARATFRPIFPDEHGWRLTEYQPLPEGHAWRLLDSHDTGHLTALEQVKPLARNRIDFSIHPDGKASYGHFVKQGEIVHPVGADSARIEADFSSFSRVLLRYHHWLAGYCWWPGKWMSLNLGRGWIGVDHAFDNVDLYGRDGAVANTMHPVRKGGNGLRMMVSHAGMTDPYGDVVGDGAKLMPLHRWCTVDVLIDRHDGYRLYLDGQLESALSGVRPVADWDGCKAIWYRHRLMHGGTPEELAAVGDYQEWFGGFFVAVS